MYDYKYHYVYYSYEEWGRGYIGVRSTNFTPSKDIYMGSFKDKTFKPTQKIVLCIFNTREEAINAEIALHNFYQVDINSHFVNRKKQTSRAFDHAGRKNPMEGRTHRLESRILMKNKAKERWKNRSYANKIIEAQKIFKWWNNGVIQKRSKDCPGRGFKRGQLPSHSQSRLGNKNPMWGKKGNLSPCFGRTGTNHPMFGKKHSEETKKRMSLAHGTGENSLAYGRRWWNNGKIRKFCKECPGPEFKLGHKLETDSRV
jgi:hypothetical protein